MSKRLVVGILAVILLVVGCSQPPVETPMPTPTAPSPARLELPQVKVACEYDNVASGDASSATAERIINALKETKVDFVFRGFFKWAPCPVKCSQFQQPDMVRQCENSGSSYELLENALSKIKEELPSVIFCLGVSAGRMGEKPARIEWNPKTGECIEQPELWAMATDPGKWGIDMSKERFQYEYSKSFHRIPKDLDYDHFDWQTPDAYCPDITNPRYQELLVSWAQGLIDAGADAIEVDLLFMQAKWLKSITHDENHPAVKESYEAACKIVDEIHKYGRLQGKDIYVGSWPVLSFNYPAPDFDFVVTSPERREVNSMILDEAKWDRELAAIKNKHGNITVFTFLDTMATTDSQMGIFSQRLSSEEQMKFLKIADDFFEGKGVIFVYPVHGGSMGRDATILSYGYSALYDSKAPEFQTHDTIKELALSKKQR